MATYEAYENGDTNGDELFGVAEFEDELTPENLVTLAALSRSLRGRQRDRSVGAKDIAESAREVAERDAESISERLLELQVRDVKTINGTNLFTYRHIERFPDLGELPNLIDDVHYEVYHRRKEKSPSPYISVNLDEILSELTVMRETHVDAVNYHRERQKEAEEYFYNLKIEEGSIHEVMTTPEGRFMVRSLHRLFRERPMGRFLANFKKFQSNRMDERPVDFNVVAARALKWFERQYRENSLLGETVVESEADVLVEYAAKPHEEHDDVLVKLPTLPQQNKSNIPPASEPDSIPIHPNNISKKQLNEDDRDEMMWFELRMRELDRARAFAMPVAEYLAAKAAIKQ